MFISLLEITPCLTFGCTEDDGDCKCYYNNACPLQRLPYYTLDECQEAVKSKQIFLYVISYL